MEEAIFGCFMYMFTPFFHYLYCSWNPKPFLEVNSRYPGE
jgi:hypothetical protein